MGLPLYRFRDSSLPPPSPTSHPGLVFDKFIRGWDLGWGKVPDKAKKELYEVTVKQDTGHLRTGLKKARERQGALVIALGGSTLERVTEWRFVSGLGVGHPFEAGFIWHRTLGVPYLPGSSVKGMIRAWAKDWGGVSDPMVRRFFGPSGEEARKNPDTGVLIVFDALPLLPPRLEVDIMNPHYGPYYMDLSGTKPPADYYSPVPVFFLAVAPGQPFEFALAPRPGAYRRGEEERAKADLEDGMRLLEDGLCNIGVGGKTAVGYGVFKNFSLPAERASTPPTAEKKRTDLSDARTSLVSFRAGQHVKAKVLENDGRLVKVRLLEANGEELSFQQPYFPGQAGETVTVKIQALGPDGRVTKVIPG